MKKWMAFLLLAAMLLSFAACGQKEEEAGTEGSRTDAVQQPQESEDPGETESGFTAPGVQTGETTSAGATQPAGQQTGNATTTRRVIGGTSGSLATTAKKTNATTQKPVSTTKRYPSSGSLTHSEYLGVKRTDVTYRSTYTSRRYKLAWIDDFSGTSVDSSVWNVAKRAANINGEKAYYQPQNAVLENGNLKIIAKKESAGGRNYTSAYLDTNGKKTFKYGRIEMYAKLPYGKGMWPAFWMTGEQLNWPWGGEIDIMEMIGDTDLGKWNHNGDSKAHWTLHWAAPDASEDEVYNGNGHKSASLGIYTMPGYVSNKTVPGLEKLADKYHLYGIEWTETKMIGYFDDQKVGEVDITGKDMRYAFHQAHHMILNLAVGGGWPGDPDETTVWPQTFAIDWVKWWQKAN